MESITLSNKRLTAEIWSCLQTYLANKHTLFWSVNHETVSTINGLTYSSLPVPVLCHLVFLCLSHNIVVHARPLSGILNDFADTLSSFQWHCLRVLYPQVDPEGQFFPSFLWNWWWWGWFRIQCHWPPSLVMVSIGQSGYNLFQCLSAIILLCIYSSNAISRFIIFVGAEKN